MDKPTNSPTAPPTLDTPSTPSQRPVTYFTYRQLASAATPTYDDALKESLTKTAQETPDLPIKAALEKASKEASERAVYSQDTWFYRGLLMGLIFIVITVVVGSIILSLQKDTMSDGIIAIGSGAVGALIGLFSQNR